MLRNFFSTPAQSCVTLLLWAHALGATIARRIVVDDAETDKILYSTGWTEPHSCPNCPTDPNWTQGYVNHGTWHSVEKISNLGNVDFNFTFNGTSVEVHIISTCTGSNFTQASYTIDEASQTAGYVHHCTGHEYLYDQTLLSVSGLSNKQHTLRVEPLTTLRLDYLVYEVEEYNGMGNSINSAGVTGTSTNLLTSLNPTSSNREVAQVGSASSVPSNLPLMIGGILSGITVFVLAIVGFLLYRSKKRSKNSEGRRPPPLLGEHSPEPTPPNPGTTSVTTYDPPGYTEKNAYFGIQSLWGNSSPAGLKGSVPL